MRSADAAAAAYKASRKKLADVQRARGAAIASRMDQEVSRPMVRDITAAELPTQKVLRAKRTQGVLAPADELDSNMSSSAIPASLHASLNEEDDDEEERGGAAALRGALSGRNAQLLGSAKGGAMLEPKPPPGSAELLRAIERGHASAAEALIAAQPALLNARFANGETPLHAALAAGGGASDILLRLLELGADPNGENREQAPPLLIAAQVGDRRGAQLLLRSRAAANSRQRVGDSPLHFAAAGGHAPIVKLLLEANASPLCRDSAGRLPWQCASTAELRALLSPTSAAAAAPPPDDTAVRAAAAAAAAEHEQQEEARAASGFSMYSHLAAEEAKERERAEAAAEAAAVGEGGEGGHSGSAAGAQASQPKAEAAEAAQPAAVPRGEDADSSAAKGAPAAARGAEVAQAASQEAGEEAREAQEGEVAGAAEQTVIDIFICPLFRMADLPAMLLLFQKIFHTAETSFAKILTTALSPQMLADAAARPAAARPPLVYCDVQRCSLSPLEYRLNLRLPGVRLEHIPALIARRQRKGKFSNSHYYIYLVETLAAIERRRSPAAGVDDPRLFLGKVRSQGFAGGEFAVYDNGFKPAARDADQPVHLSRGDSKSASSIGECARHEVGAVVYTRHTGHRKPMEMRVLAPLPGHAPQPRPRSAGGSEVPVQLSIDALKAVVEAGDNAASLPAHTQLLRLVPPKWNEIGKVYQLAFEGRAACMSNKNVQLESTYQPGKPMLQVGKLAEHIFNVDHGLEISTYLGFCVALTVFDQSSHWRQWML